MNKEIKREALAFVTELSRLYFGQRDTGSLLSYMEGRTSWIGTGEGDLVFNMEEARRMLEREIAEYDGTFTIQDTQLEVTVLSERLCVVYGTLHTVPEDDALAEEDLRVTLVLEKTRCGMRLVHLHFSHADSEQEQGRFFVPKAMRANSRTLRRTLDAREKQLALLTRNIPGGAHQCLNDPNLTLLSMSDGFFGMFGYSREEIRTEFHDRYIEMVYPGDRAELLKTVRRQLMHGRDIELEYRVLRKNKPPVWILDKGRLLETADGEECFFCVVIEITDRKREQEELRLSLERHQVIMDQTTDIIFEWDIPEDTLSFSSNWRKKFGYEPINSSVTSGLPLSKNIHPDDMPVFLKLMNDTAAGVPYSETEFRIRDAGCRYLWCRIRATTQYDTDHRPIKAVGVIIDIDAEKKQKQALLEQAQRDALTGLYNKAATNTLVEQRMLDKGSKTLQALMIIDLDNFKEVNDTYGHLCGDSVLSDAATILKNHIRASDLVGRIGGDEFLVYLPEISDEAAARMKAETLLAALQQIVPDKNASAINCSVGVALFPRGSIDYFALYKCADQALYFRKRNGRGGIAFYNPSLCADQIPCGGAESAVSDAIGSDRMTDEQMAQYAFRSLYSAVNIEESINRLLEIIGRSFDVSRVYIFESSEDGITCSNTFEWCNAGVTAEIENLQNLSYLDDLGDYTKNFDGNGMFYCHDIETLHPDLYGVLAPQGIFSMLQCAMLDSGEFRGYVGFDECRENRSWTRDQIAAFQLTANVLSSFLVKLRLKQRLEREKERAARLT